MNNFTFLFVIFMRVIDSFYLNYFFLFRVILRYWTFYHFSRWQCCISILCLDLYLIAEPTEGWPGSVAG